MAGSFCEQCSSKAERLCSELNDQTEALAKSDKIRGQLRVATEHLQKRLAKTEKELQETRSLLATDASPSSKVDSSRFSANNCEGGGSASSSSRVGDTSEPHNATAQDLRLDEALEEQQAEWERKRRELSQKLQEAEARVSAQEEGMERLRKTMIDPEVHAKLQEEFNEIRSKEEQKPKDPLDALEALTRDLEKSANLRKSSFTNTLRCQQLSTQVTELEEKLAKAEATNAYLKEHSAEIEEEAKGLRGACIDSSNAMVKKYDDLYLEMKLIRKEQQENYQKMSLLESENTSLKKLCDEGKIQRVEDELKTLTTEITRLRTCNAALCSQLFGEEEKVTSRDAEASMLIAGQQSMDAPEGNVEEIQLGTIIRLQRKLTEMDERHMEEKNGLMEKVQSLEKHNANRMMVGSSTSWGVEAVPLSAPTRQPSSAPFFGGSSLGPNPSAANASVTKSSVAASGAAAATSGLNAASAAASRYLPTSLPSVPTLKANWSALIG